MSKGRTVELNYGSEKLVSTAQSHPLETRGLTPDGRVFCYSFLSSAGAVTAGKICQAAAISAGHGKDLAVKEAAAVGATSVKITLATTAVLVDEYADGSIQVNDVDGEGHLYRIASAQATPGKAHLAGTATADVIFYLAPGETIRTALTVNSQVGLVHNLHKNVIIQPTSITGITIGATPADVALSSYFWAQTWGPASILINGTPTIGKQVIWGATTAGSVDIKVATDIAPQLGYVMGGSTVVSTEYALIFLTIAP